ncbi:MAG TPA: HepT-like ribonuclease domain-containing protein [Acetobacteraceae bacterium]|jgi:uncharacterized protein with HEPN domain|nr:HepT-like ribonuclease domain-containing protein [Acetobacteraceae bacterium]
MEHDPRAWLWDVRRAADSIAAFVESRSFADYAADLMLRSAVERQFEIAGEALNRLSQEVPEVATRLPDLRRVIAMRNALIHGDREVDNATVWQTIHEDLPALREQVQALLVELGEHP